VPACAAWVFSLRVFTLEAAQAVMSDQGYAPSVVLDEITNLVAKSLVTLDGSAPNGRWRAARDDTGVRPRENWLKAVKRNRSRAAAPNSFETSSGPSIHGLAGAT